jgi:hypothetical protein
MITARSNSNTPFTAIPTRRNGNVSNHTNGYNTRANSASGQQRIRRMHHRRNFTMRSPFFTYLQPTIIDETLVEKNLK